MDSWIENSHVVIPRQPRNPSGAPQINAPLPITNQLATLVTKKTLSSKDALGRKGGRSKIAKQDRPKIVKLISTILFGDEHDRGLIKSLDKLTGLEKLSNRTNHITRNNLPMCLIKTARHIPSGPGALN
uniref:Uncharacterized protein n=1 Tax=Cannabis sativa TaxID=3483 RepID=A0A803P886_CANSA